MIGSIKVLDGFGRCGFVIVEGRERDVYFHERNLLNCTFDDLRVGYLLSFDLEDSQMGPQAVNIKVDFRPAGISS